MDKSVERLSYQEWCAAQEYGFKTISGLVYQTVNPIYAGVGPFPPIVSRDVYVGAAKKLIEEIGIDMFLQIQLDSLQYTFKGMEEKK